MPSPFPQNSFTSPSQFPQNSLNNSLNNSLGIPSKITARPFSKSHQNSLHVHLNHISFKIPARSPQKSSTLPSQSQQHSIKIPSKPHQHPINIQTNTSAFLQMSFIIAAQFPHKSSGKIPAQFPEIPKHSKIPSTLKTFWRVYLKVPQRAELVDCVGPKLLNKVISECPKSLNSFLVCPRHFLTNLPQRVSQLSACSQSMPATFRESHLKISQLTSCHMHI